MALEPQARQELELLLGYVTACRAVIDGWDSGTLPNPGTIDGAHIRSTTWAYVGGAMTVLGRLGLVTGEEHREWWQRIEEVLGPPEGGSAVAPTDS